MKVSYYPGCTLEGTAWEYGQSIKAISKILEFELCELEDWNCCGASSAHYLNESLALALPARNLLIAEREERDLVIPCAACYHRLKTAERNLINHPRLSEGKSYQGRLKIKNLLEFLVEDLMQSRIQALVKIPLQGLKAVAYYGCLLVRPPELTGVKNYEDPQSMDQLLSLLEMETLPWPYKTDCCGGSLALTRPDLVKKLVDKLLNMAYEVGADCLVTACPLCQANLDLYQEEISKKLKREYHLPVFYFTELMGLALGSKGVKSWLKRHLVDPRRLLSSKNLI